MLLPATLAIEFYVEMRLEAVLAINRCIRGIVPANSSCGVMISCYNHDGYSLLSTQPDEAHWASIVQLRHKLKKKDAEDLVLRFFLIFKHELLNAYISCYTEN